MKHYRLSVLAAHTKDFQFGSRFSAIGRYDTFSLEFV